jgi:hypothetical protein
MQEKEKEIVDVKKVELPVEEKKEMVQEVKKGKKKGKAQ